MIGFLKHKVWVSQLAQTLVTYDNRDIKGNKTIAYNILDKIISIKKSIFTRAT